MRVEDAEGARAALASLQLGGAALEVREVPTILLFFFFTLVTGPRRSLNLKLSDARVYEPQIRALLVTTTHFCEVVVLKFNLMSTA